jgi:LuxR family transcriptional regulator, maltose regulon positive regulatory protein
VSLDRADNDPVTFVASVLAAVDPIVHLGGSTAGALNVPAPPLDDVVLPAVVDTCAQSGQPFVLVLDDVHLVTEARCHKIIDYLSQRLPVGCQLWLATRSDPALPFATLRAHGRLVELRAADLALSKSEAVALLAAAGVPLSDDQVDRLVDRTEGWPAALYLAALSLRDRSDPEDFVDRFAGTSRHVADFLSEDVLARQPNDVIDFLLQTCILEELTPALCQALTGRLDSEAALRELERSNLFVVPLEDERLAYRYHHLSSSTCVRSWHVARQSLSRSYTAAPGGGIASTASSDGLSHTLKLPVTSTLRRYWSRPSTPRWRSSGTSNRSGTG